MNKKYVFFDKFVFRTPLYSYDRAHLKSNIEDNAFDEGLFLASPELYRERNKMVASGKSDAKMEQSLYKYLTRATTRCTPFGLFAGCSTGSFGEGESAITLVDRESYRRALRLDMDYLCSLVENLETRPEIREKIKYYANDSIYDLGGKLRYVEYEYRKKQRIHKISSVDRDEYLTGVLEFVGSGKYIHEIVEHLTDDEIDAADAREYVEELIAAQLLKSELGLSVTGNDALDELIKQLQSIDDGSEIVGKLSEIRRLLNAIEATPLGGATQDHYRAIVSIVKEIGVDFEPKYLFQCDMYKPVACGTLSAGIKDDLASLIDLLVRITPRQSSSVLDNFRHTFKEYYEEREMPLLQLLDSELGIGFAANGTMDEPNELLKGLGGKIDVAPQGPSLPKPKSVVESVMFKKYLEYIRTGADKIVLEDTDFSRGKHDHDSVPATMHMICSVIGDKMLLKSCGGSCGANLLGRFGHIDRSIENLSKEITGMDQELNSDVILAEIVHWPESRTGNILFRPSLRDYELHYLARPSVGEEFRISLSDLMVSVRGNRVILRSKRLGKEIVPRLTSAHNYSSNVLPVYRFLCELQAQNMHKGLFFSKGDQFADQEHYPRVEYKNVVLSRAKWHIDKKSFPDKYEDVASFLEEKRIPSRVIIADGDNEQYIDFNDEQGVALFRDMMGKRKSILVKEFLFDEGDSPVNDNSGGRYCNEFIFICRKE